MSGLFHVENPFFGGINKIVDALALNMLWLICCLPVFTIGTSTTAFYYTVHKTIRGGRGYVSREFFRCFKREFCQTIKLWMLFLPLYVLFGLDFFIIYRMAQNGRTVHIPAVVFLILLAVITGWAQYIFAYVARFSDPSKEVLKLTAYIAVANFPRTIGMVLVAGAGLYIVYRFAPAILFVPVMGMIIVNSMMEKVFVKYMSPEQIEIVKEEERR